MQKADYKVELVEFTTTDNLFLPGLLFTPQGKKTNQAAIFLHGNGSASVFYSVTRAKALAQQFTNKGISLLLFNNRGAHFIKTVNKIIDSKEQEGQVEREDVTLGCSYELIKDCVHDINGAVNFFRQQGYNQLFLIGHSSGANKICVYDHYQPQNPIKKYVLLSGGDDSGIYYQMIGDKSKFWQYLKQAKEKTEQGRGTQLVPKYIVNRLISYQSFFDIANPDGDYNTFPFTELQEELGLSTKPLFRYFKAINKPSWVVYGELDEHAPKKSGTKALSILSNQVQDKDNFEFKLITDADHSFHGLEDKLGQLLTEWVL